ncbi:hypothetical protein BBC27_05780 [Acidithiobacillus ferrivorans]|uniref:ProQ/FinO domain-containing protein n=1 Tax=Acidithiobacillus ferrivorans TaxID=160808 RepID=A0A1B9C1W0_9PROT|nr:ProQ/FINO family protein [Acidithiobacillus ferrivorans]OCB03904.1 hypothetical protein BBC27_05780 [Acidithiobacillus ferrivorans]
MNDETFAEAEAPGLTKKQRKAIAKAEFFRIKKLKEEILAFPVFQGEEVLPLKYYIHKDIYQVIKQRRRDDSGAITKLEKAEIKAGIQSVLKKYCKRMVYYQAAIAKGKRYFLDGTEEYGITSQDMAGFSAFLALYQRTFTPRANTEVSEGEEK